MGLRTCRLDGPFTKSMWSGEGRPDQRPSLRDPTAEQALCPLYPGKQGWDPRGGTNPTASGISLQAAGPSDGQAI